MKKSELNLNIEDQENDFIYRKKKTGLNIQFNRVAFIFFIFFIKNNSSIFFFRR